MLLAVLLCPALFNLQCSLECKGRGHADACCIKLLTHADSAHLLQVTQLVMTGEWSNSSSKEALELCMGGCAQIDSVVRQCLQQAAVSS